MASHSGIRPNQVIQVPNQIINPEAIIPKSRTYTCRICGVSLILEKGNFVEFVNKKCISLYS